MYTIHLFEFNKHAKSSYILRCSFHLHRSKCVIKPKYKCKARTSNSAVLTAANPNPNPNRHIFFIIANNYCIRAANVEAAIVEAAIVEAANVEAAKLEESLTS